MITVETIRERHSVREYDGGPLDQAEFDALGTMVEGCAREGSNGRLSRGVLRGVLGFGCCRLGFVAAAIEWEELNKRSINDIAR